MENHITLYIRASNDLGFVSNGTKLIAHMVGIRLGSICLLWFGNSWTKDLFTTGVYTGTRN